MDYTSATKGRISPQALASVIFKEKQHDLYLVDIRTPEMNGKELYQWLKEKYPQMASRVIFTSGSVMGEDTRTFAKQTGRPFLPKPFTPDELKAIVRETLKEVEK